MVTNQDVINIFYGAADVLGVAGGWTLVQKAGWEWLGDDRQAAFDPSHLDDKPPDLSEAEWAHLHMHISEELETAGAAIDDRDSGHGTVRAELAARTPTTIHHVRQSKMGYGILAGFDPQFVRAILDTQPRGVLLLEEHANDLIEDVINKTAFPSVRWFWEDTFRADHRPADWLAHVEGRLGGNLGALSEHAINHGKRLHFQSFNEPDVRDLSLVSAYGEFEGERARITWERYGAVSLVGSFAMGTTSPELMRAFLVPELLWEIRLGHAYLSLHEYFYALPWCWMGDFQDGDIVPDDRSTLPPVVEAGTEAWLLGRFQHAGIPEWMPIVLTEFGADSLSQDQVQRYGLPARNDGRPFGGYRTLMPWWGRTFPALARNADRFYGHDLLGWCDRYLQQFPQVLWAAVFSGVGPHHEDRYADFDLAWTKALPASLEWVQEQGWTDVTLPMAPPIT